MTSKTLLQNDKALSGWWAAIAHSENFSRVMIHARAEMMSQEMSVDAIRGARILEGLLATIADSEESLPMMPGPGLNHDLESDLRRPAIIAGPKVPTAPEIKKKKGK